MVQDLADKEAPYKMEDGEVFDEDSGKVIGFIDCGEAIPAQLSVVFKNYFYVFKIYHREEITEEERKQIEDGVNLKPESLTGEDTQLPNDSLKDL